MVLPVSVSGVTALRLVTASKTGQHGLRARDANPVGAKAVHALASPN
jgi:hypothetical protein